MREKKRDKNCSEKEDIFTLITLFLIPVNEDSTRALKNYFSLFDYADFSLFFNGFSMRLRRELGRTIGPKAHNEVLGPSNGSIVVGPFCKAVDRSRIHFKNFCGDPFFPPGRLQYLFNIFGFDILQ
jgi:hypothetical protein